MADKQSILKREIRQMWTDNVRHAKRFQRPSIGNEVGKTLERNNEYINPRNRRNEHIIQLHLD